MCQVALPALSIWGAHRDTELSKLAFVWRVCQTTARRRTNERKMNFTVRFSFVLSCVRLAGTNFRRGWRVAGQCVQHGSGRPCGRGGGCAFEGGFGSVQYLLKGTALWRKEGGTLVDAQQRGCGNLSADNHRSPNQWITHFTSPSSSSWGAGTVLYPHCTQSCSNTDILVGG